MTDSFLFPSISSPNFVINIRLSTPKLPVHLASLNFPPLLHILGKNVVSLPLRSQNIQELYALHQVTFALLPPNSIPLYGLPALFGLTFPPLSHLTGPLSFISMLMLLSPSLPVPLLLLMTFSTPPSRPLTLLLAPMVSPTLPGESAPLLLPFV